MKFFVVLIGLVFVVVLAIALGNGFGKANELRAQGDLEIKQSQAELLQKRAEQMAIENQAKAEMLARTASEQATGETAKIYGGAFAFVVGVITLTLALCWYALGTVQVKNAEPRTNRTGDLISTYIPTTKVTLFFKGNINPFPVGLISPKGDYVVLGDLSDQTIAAIVQGNTQVALAYAFQSIQAGHDRVEVVKQLTGMFAAMGRQTTEIDSIARSLS